MPPLKRASRSKSASISPELLLGRKEVGQGWRRTLCCLRPPRHGFTFQAERVGGAEAATTCCISCRSSTRPRTISRTKPPLVCMHPVPRTVSLDRVNCRDPPGVIIPSPAKQAERAHTRFLAYPFPARRGTAARTPLSSSRRSTH